MAIKRPKMPTKLRSNTNPTTALIIRRAVASDAPSIRTLRSALITFESKFRPHVARKNPKLTWLKKDTLTQLDDSDAAVFVAANGKRVLGYVLCRICRPLDLGIMKENRYMNLDEIFVTPELRSRGIGRILVKEVMEFAKKSKIKRILLGAYRTNPVSIPFWKNCGFTTYKELLDISL